MQESRDCGDQISRKREVFRAVCGEKSGGKGKREWLEDASSSGSLDEVKR